jgi:DNA modification methylase
LDGIDAAKGVTCRIWNRDCITGMEDLLEADSIDLTVTSPPFEELFTYSGKIEDVGNNGSTMNLREGRFAINLRFWAKQLLRVHRPGTNACLHIQQLLSYKVQHGNQGRRDFRGALIDIMRETGWNYTGEIAISKDPQVIARTSHLHSLQFKTGHTRGSQDWAPAPNDYVLIFQKPGESLYKVRPLRYMEKNPTGWMVDKDWIEWARGHWDIDQFDVIDGATSKKKLDELKESEDEKHCCPLQIEVLRRLVMMYSNPVSRQANSTILDPFMGVGSTAFVGLNGASPQSGKRIGEPRNVVGFELKRSYYEAAVKHARIAFDPRHVRKHKESSLFPEDS